MKMLNKRKANNKKQKEPSLLFMDCVKFATAINCIDGRTHLLVIEWLKNHYRVDYVDMITEAGPNKILAECIDVALINSLKKKVEVSVNMHGSKLVAIVGHYDCAGNLENEAMQIVHIKKAIKTIDSWGIDAKVLGLWIDHKWEIQEIK